MATTDALLKVSPAQHIAQRKNERSPSSEILSFPANLGAHATLMRFFQYTYGGAKGTKEQKLADKKAKDDAKIEKQAQKEREAKEKQEKKAEKEAKKAKAAEEKEAKKANKTQTNKPKAKRVTKKNQKPITETTLLANSTDMLQTYQKK